MAVQQVRRCWRRRQRKPRSSNLSIGWNCVVGVAVKSVENRLKGKSTGLFITTKHNNQRFEFVFTYAGAAAPLALSTSGKPQSDKSQSANECLLCSEWCSPCTSRTTTRSCTAT